MKIIKIAILVIFLIKSPYLIKGKENGVLYLWEISEKKVWKSFGDDETQQKYKGEIKYGQPHGLGVGIFLNKTKYMGQWKHGKQHGQGTLIFPDGTKSSGEWKENKGWNIKKYENNGRINDEYVNGVRQINNKKEGILFWRENEGSFGWHETGDEKNDYKYTGEVENNLPNGWGKFAYPSGYTYEGQYKDGKRTGKVVFLFRMGKKVLDSSKKTSLGKLQSMIMKVIL